jgi:3-hydroxyacyl-CoA dehydrogenase
MSRFQVKKVAVLGAGVMGAQIAAHLVNVKVPVILFDLAAKEGPKNGIVIKAVEGLKKLKPAPLGVPEDAALIQQANYEENMELLKECDLIIEAIAERMDWKTDLYHKIAPFIAEGAIVASNTSGLSITKLSEALPESIKPRFCGIHFFNPPRYMTLVELINTPTTEPKVLDDLEAFVTSALGKGVIRAHDTPNFIANRVGIASMLATIKEADTFKLSYDVVDDLTGKKLGRASSGTFRTADVVGLDTMAHVIKTLQDNLGPVGSGKVEDPFSDVYGTPPVLAKLLESKSLGQKTGAGFYKKQGRDILRLDPESMEYVPAAAMAKVGTSAIESRKIGYLLDSDVIVPNKDELLFVALNEARALFNSGYRAPHKRQFPVVGRSGLATIKGQLVNMRDGGFISAHDFHIASLIAGVVCGGDVDAGTLVTEEYLMTLERKAFCSLLEHPKTQERIMGMMSTGKPVRN